MNLSEGAVNGLVQDFLKIGKLSEIEETSATFRDFEPPLYNVWKQQEKSEGVSHPGTHAEEAARP